MPKLLTLQCPSCAHEFTFLRHPADEPLPRFCGACGFDSQAAEFGVPPAAPHIRDRVTQAAVDQTYESMVAASENNAHAAAEMAGCDVSEMASLKITDLKSNLYAGETAAPSAPPMPQLTGDQAAMAHMARQVNTGGPQAAAAMAAGTTSGPYAYRGTQTLQSVIRPGHARNGGVTTDAPALEIASRDASIANLQRAHNSRAGFR